MCEKGERDVGGYRSESHGRRMKPFFSSSASMEFCFVMPSVYAGLRILLTLCAVANLVFCQGKHHTTFLPDIHPQLLTTNTEMIVPTPLTNQSLVCQSFVSSAELIPLRKLVDRILKNSIKLYRELYRMAL